MTGHWLESKWHRAQSGQSENAQTGQGPNEAVPKWARADTGSGTSRPETSDVADDLAAFLPADATDVLCTAKADGQRKGEAQA